MCGDARTWADQSRRLAPRFRCIAYDRRGHSRSPLGDVQQRSVEMHADDAAGLIRALGIAPCVVVGSSGGARIGLDLVRRHPEVVAGAALSEPPVFALDPAGGAAFVETLKPRIGSAVAAGGPRAGVDAFFEVVCPGLWTQLPDSGRERFRANDVELFGDLQMPPYQIEVDDLPSISRPCLFITGSESMPVFRNIARTLASNVPSARLVELAGSGHVTYFERPAEFSAAVASFAEEVTAQAGLDAASRRSVAGH